MDVHSAGIFSPFIQQEFIVHFTLCQALTICRWIGHGACKEQKSLVNLRTATRRNLCRVLNGLMVISQGRRTVSCIPARGNSKDRGTEIRNSLAVNASCYWSFGKEKLQVGNLLRDLWFSASTVVICPGAFLGPVLYFLVSVLTGSIMHIKYS